MMTWEKIIAFTENNIPHRYGISTDTAPGSDQCQVTVMELDEAGNRIGEFKFTYDLKQQIPLADFNLHNKPIPTILIQMLDIEPDTGKW